MVRVLILRGPGTNCDMETSFAFKMAGAEVKHIYIDTLIENKKELFNYEILVIPGGFTYGDDLGAGTVMAARLSTIRETLDEFVGSNKLLLGICNGFQILVKSGLLPGFGGRNVTLANIPEGKLRDEWLNLEAVNNRCVFLKGIDNLYIPMANGEGRLLTKDRETLRRIEDGGYVALRYKDYDPTDSDNNIAGITDKSGRILGLMPHPERNIFNHSPPNWQDGRCGGEGLRVFENAVEYFG